MTRVGFASRFGAALIDGGLIAVVLHLVLLVDAMASRIGIMDFGMLTAVLGGLGLVLYGLLDVYMNGTPGKKLLKIAIAAEDGTLASDSMLLRRWAVKCSGLLFAALGVGLITIAEGLWRNWGRDTREVLIFVGVIDLIVGGLLMLVILVTTMTMIFKPDFRPLQDTLSGTSVFRSADVMTQRGFEPLVARAMTNDQRPNDESMTNDEARMAR